MAPLVVHVIYRLDFGGLESLLVDCVNRMPANQFRHAIVCLTDYTDFAKRITRSDVELIALHKQPGPGWDMHAKLWRLLRRLRPAVLHTYNLGTVEYNLTAALAGVPVRVHAEHGRESSDPHGTNRKHNLLRKLMLPFIDAVVPVSSDLQRWLKTTIGVPDSKNCLISNGVDTDKFHPAATHENAHIVIGTVGRIQDVKNHLGLVDAFIRLREKLPQYASRLKLHIIGDGPLLATLREKVDATGLNDVVWLPGARSDVAQLMQGFDVFVMSSHIEGTPVVLLEAMAAGLPVVATRVGGIPDVILENETGLLAPPANPAALADALAKYVQQPALATQHGQAGRKRAEQSYSIDAMVKAYADLYQTLTNQKTHRSS